MDFSSRKRSFDSKSVEENDLHAGTECKVFVPREQSISECLEDGKVIRSFWELRQEVKVLFSCKFFANLCSILFRQIY